MKKAIFVDNGGNIHFGINAPSGFQEGKQEDVIRALKNLGQRKAWRCNVCNDLHISARPLEECPTCYVADAYVKIDLNEFKKLMEIL